MSLVELCACHHMVMSNPVLTRSFDEKKLPQQPIVEPTSGVMTTESVGRHAALLFGITAVFAIGGWVVLETVPRQLLLIGILVGFGLVLLASFKPNLAPYVAVPYAVIEGVVVGAISRMFETAYSGIVVQALLATLITFAVMLALYITRTIRVTQRMRSVIIGATAAIALFYLVTIGLSFFNIEMPLVWDSGPLGILFSVAVCALAVFNLMLDFDFIERGIKARMPSHMSWLAAMGLLVTVVWLYLEILRLLAKVRD
ncbi:MAG: hypothetical protein GEU79_16250 [Acidimicrobiia bacterium]|nr:hypothetical protein [Acidimicrobiia bacterium]